MNLIVEIGNSRLKILVFENNQIINEQKMDVTDHDFSLDYLQTYSIKKAILSGSGDMSHPVILKIKALFPFIKKFDTNLIQSIHYKYKTPETLGEDRLINAFASSKIFPNQQDQ